MSEEVKLVEPTKEAIDFARKVVTTKAFAGIIIVGTVTMDTDSATVEGVLRGGHTWEQNIAKIVSTYAQQREQAAYEAGRAAGKAEERERVVVALERFATQYPQSLGSGSTYALTAEMTLSKAIAIAREEGGT